jgi:hypothetical protein
MYNVRVRNFPIHMGVHDQFIIKTDVQCGPVVLFCSSAFTRSENRGVILRASVRSVDSNTACWRLPKLI